MILETKTQNSAKLKMNSTEIEENKQLIFLGTTIDNLLTFKELTDNLFRVANYKLHALQRITKYLSLEEAWVLFNNIINSQLKYAPLIWPSCEKSKYEDSKDSPQTTKGGL